MNVENSCHVHVMWSLFYSQLNLAWCCEKASFFSCAHSFLSASQNMSLLVWSVGDAEMPPADVLTGVKATVHYLLTHLWRFSWATKHFWSALKELPKQLNRWELSEIHNSTNQINGEVLLISLGKEIGLLNILNAHWGEPMLNVTHFSVMMTAITQVAARCVPLVSQHKTASYSYRGS